MKLCLAFHSKWFALRDEFETDIGIDKSYRIKDGRFKESLGMCSGYGDNRYIPIPVPK